MESIRELEEKLSKLKREEQQKEYEKRLEENYQEFKDRDSDAIVGKAHCESVVDDKGYYKDPHTIGSCISISGNCGTSYKAQVFVTSATHTYFHNVWSHQQERIFQEKLNNIAVREIKKIMGSLRCTLELLGLQSNHYHLTHSFPVNRVKNIEEELWEETVKVLNKFKDKDFMELAKNYRRWHSRNEKTGESTVSKDVNLNHSKHILKKYLIENRKHLIKYFKDIDSFIQKNETKED